MPVTKIDPKIIFASDAPSQDQPAVFSNKPTGWGVSRQNGGRPTIKQANSVQQDTDLKILWLNENAVLPYDASLDYPVNAVTIKDRVFKIFNGSVWNLFLDKTSVGLGNVDNTSDSSKPISTATQSALNLKANQTSVDTELAKKADKLVTYTKVDVDGLLGLKADLNIVKRGIGNIYSSTLTYSINERVILTNGDVVKSIVNGNTNNPNTNMVGWILDSLTPSKNLADLPNVSVARDNLGVYSEAEVDAIFAGATVAPDASTTVKGIVRLATESDITTSSENVAVTPKDVNNMLIGVGASAKGFRALFSARLTRMVGTNTSSGATITATITSHGLAVGDVIQVNYRYSLAGRNQEANGDTVTVASVTNANTFVFTSPWADGGTSTGGTCTLFYVIKNKYNINSLTIFDVGRYTISINAASGITGTNFIPFVSATTVDNSLIQSQPEVIVSATYLTVRTFDKSGVAITPQWLHIGVAQ